MPEPIDLVAFNQFEVDGWARVPDAYHRYLGPITARAAEPLLDAARVGEGTTVLDVATGPGYLAGRAAARGARVVGTDISPQILAIARRQHPEIEFRRSDAYALQLRDCSFAAVVEPWSQRRRRRYRMRCARPSIR